jgi:hypothetical protein
VPATPRSTASPASQRTYDACHDRTCGSPTRSVGTSLRLTKYDSSGSRVSHPSPCPKASTWRHAHAPARKILGEGVAARVHGGGYAGRVAARTASRRCRGSCRRDRSPAIRRETRHIHGTRAPVGIHQDVRELVGTGRQVVLAAGEVDHDLAALAIVDAEVTAGLGDVAARGAVVVEAVEGGEEVDADGAEGLGRDTIAASSSRGTMSG